MDGWMKGGLKEEGSVEKSCAKKRRTLMRMNGLNELCYAMRKSD